MRCAGQFARLADKYLVPRGLRHGISRRGHRPTRKIIHRMLLPGHPARWSVDVMAGLLTSRVVAFPAFPYPSGHSGVGERSSLTVAGAVMDSAPFGYTSPCSLFTRPCVAWPGTINATHARARRAGQAGRRFSDTGLDGLPRSMGGKDRFHLHGLATDEGRAIDCFIRVFGD